MHGHPIQGIKGARAPKPENGKFAAFKPAWVANYRASEEYLVIRNAGQRAKAGHAQTELAKARGETVA
jgi:hypothetical protein